MIPRIPGNVFVAIEARRYGNSKRSLKSMYRYNNRLMRNLVASPNWFFKRVMKMRTSKTIEFDCPDKLYAMNNRQCYALRGPKGEPTLRYTIDAKLYPGRWRYEAQLSIMRAGMSNPNLPKSDLRLLLTSESLLEVREENTGKLIDLIDLNSPDSPEVKFNVLRWDSSHDQVIAISTRPKGRPKILCHIIVLGICPEIRKKIRIPILKDVFGKDITDVVLLEGVLKTMHRNETVRVYDFDEVCRNNRTVDGVYDKVLHISKLGEPLLVVSNTSEMPEFHGKPWHYTACSRRLREHAVRSMDHRILGTFPMNEDETLLFHPDDSGVISHGQRKTITLYKVIYDESTNTESLKKLREIKLMSSEPPDNHEMDQLGRRRGYALPLRRSRRMARIAPPPSMDDDERILFADDFENELNLDLLMGTDTGDPLKRGVLQMFDHETGVLVKTIQFQRQLREYTEYMIALDLDVLIVVGNRQGHDNGEAHVYRLLHREAWGEENPNAPYELPSSTNLPRELDADYVP